MQKIKGIMRIWSILLLAGMTAGLASCSRAGGNETGHEFMPDMAHSVAYEANVYFDYTLNRWDKESVVDRRAMAQPRNPVFGTIARGYAGADASILSGSYNHNAIAIQANGSVPYYFADTEEERTRAMAEIKTNPFPVTERGLITGKELYDVFCGVCHGEKADGAGYLVRDDGGVYPAQPANLVSDEFIAASEGRFYHGIMYGKNVMGGYSDKLSYEERWQVIHYIRSLQAKVKGLPYGPSAVSATPDSASTAQTGNQ